MMIHRRTLMLLIVLAIGLLPSVTRLTADDQYGDPLPSGALARLGTTRLRHGETAELVAFLPGGKALVTLGGDGVVRQWDLETGKLQRQFKTRSDNNNMMMGRGVAFVGGAAMVFNSGIQGGTAISADGKTLAVRPDWNGSIQVWDTVAGKELRKIDASQTSGGLAEIGISPDGKTVAARNYDNSIRVIDVATGKKVRELGKKPDNNNGNTFYGGNSGLTFSPDGKVLVSTAGENVKGKQVWSLILHHTATGKELHRISSEEQNAMPMSPTFAPDGKTLVWMRWDGSIHFADPATGKELRQVKSQNDWGAEFLIAPDGKTLLVKSQNTGLRILDFTTGKEQRKFDRRAPQPQVFFNNGGKGGLAMSADGKLAAVAGEDHAIRLFDLTTGKEREFGGGHRSAVVAVQYAADGKSITTRGQDGTLRVWDPSSGKEQKEIKAPQGAYHFALSPTGRDLLVGDQSNTATIRDPATQKVERTLPGPKEGIGALAFSADGKMAAVYGSADKGVSIWLYDSLTGRQRRRIKLPAPAADANGNFAIPNTGVTGMAFSPDGRLIGAMTSYNALGLWETETGKELMPIQAPDQTSIQGAIFTPDSRCLVLDFGDDSLRLWEIASGKERRHYGKKPNPQPQGNMGMVWFGGGFGGAPPMPFMRPAAACAVSPNGRLLAQARVNHTLSLWDLATGQELGQLKGHEGAIETVAFAPDGKTLATGSRDTTGLVWDVSKFAGNTKPPSGDANLEARWKQLAGDDARVAFEAIHALAGLPGPSVAFVKEHVHAASAVDAAKLTQLIADLDSDRFDVRKQASTALEKLGEPVVPALQKALEGDPSEEVRKRIESLLAKTNRNTPRGEALRSLRAIEVLETIGTPEARAVLQTLAQGVAEASLTRAAQGALERLGRGS
jgi:WD40 repeat protein